MLRARMTVPVLAAFAAAALLFAPAAAAAGPGGGASSVAAPGPAPAGRGLAAGVGATLVGPVRAGLDDFAFDSLDVDYTLSRAEDGTSRLRVVEAFVAAFPDFDQNHGMRRSIPDSYNGQPVKPRLISITDEHGDPRPAEVDQEDGVFSMTSREGGFVHGRQSYVFTYELSNVTWDFPDTGLEFYWDVNGVDWAQPFGSVTARLHLDPTLAGALTGEQSCYRGAQGATDTCQISSEAAADGGATVTATAGALAPFETATIAVGFAPGTFTPFDSSFLASGWGWAQGAAGLALLGGVGAAVGIRRTRLRDEPGRPTIIAEYEPPAGIDALESAVLLSRQPKAIPAEVLEQAIVGSIRIVEGEPGRFSKAKLRAELVDRSRADADGRMLLDGLFRSAGPGAVYEFGRQDTRFSVTAQAILKAAETELAARGLRRAVPRGAKGLPMLLVTVAAVLLFVFGFLAIGSDVNPLVPVIGFVVAVVGFFVAAGLLVRKPLTAQGAEVRDHLQGLREFIAWAEADRIRMLQSPTTAERKPIDVNDPREMLRIYEPLLPYAVVFGQERQWADRLMVLYGSAGAVPYWYSGTGPFNAASFSSSIATLSAAASSSSSTSGGSSGGGSAGGGGGGGGGGGV